MKDFLNDSLHVFIVTMIFILGIGGALITGGTFDNWTSRLITKKRKALLKLLKAKNRLAQKQTIN
jgi:hypothetical protein